MNAQQVEELKYSVELYILQHVILQFLVRLHR